MAVADNGRGWKVLFYALGATCLMWSLVNLTPLLMEYFIEGEITKLTGVSFCMGLYGVFSGGIITILGEKIGFLGKEDYEKGRAIAEEVSNLAAGTLVETKGQKATKDVIEAKAKGVSIEEHKEDKYGDKDYDYGVKEEEIKKKQDELDAKKKEIAIETAKLEAELKAEGVEVPTPPKPIEKPELQPEATTNEQSTTQ